MQTGTILLVILSAVIALLIVLYQYYYKAKSSALFKGVLAFLRFLALFCVFLLLINPKFTKNEYVLDKTNLVLLLDNSSSLNGQEQKEQLADIADQLKSNTPLQENFRFNAYSFGRFLNTSDSLSHEENVTNISEALSTVKDIYSKEATAVVLATDGNQTIGEDYEFYGAKQGLPIYPVVLGDTTQYADIRIDQLNTNRYAFLKNRFPVEAYVSYQGQGTVSGVATVSIDGKTVYREQLDFSSTNSSKIINTLIEANTVGVKEVKVKISALDNERNLANNERIAAVEVIDEKTNVAIISEILHPDIGALKKAIESNEQRAVTIKKPGTPLAGLEEVDLFILYQPRQSFRDIYQYSKDKDAPSFTVTGSKTNWNFLNAVQNSFNKSSFNESEEMSPVLNPGFGIFDVSDFSITDFPPLEGYLGEILITKKFETILEQKIKGVPLNEPLLAIISDETQREAVLFAENVWKWRSQAFRNNREFKNFDDLIAKIVRYLATKEAKSRLTLEYQNTYQGINETSISASYFDEAFNFDGNASITVNIKNKENTLSREIPMLLMNGYYKADLGNLPAGQYNFTVSVANENISKSGSFTKLDFDVEKQLFSSDYRKLERLAQASNASLFYPSQLTNLVEDLLSNPQFVPTQKSNQNIVSLIDFRLLLGLMVLALAAEWFIRKYNGLI
ncbi:MAG: vWA domain-containing protein [Flavobacteriaceae bacterium]